MEVPPLSAAQRFSLWGFLLHLAAQTLYESFPSSSRFEVLSADVPPLSAAQMWKSLLGLH